MNGPGVHTQAAANRSRLDLALQTAVDHLIAEMHPDGWWQGRLSTSALSTSTAVSALSVWRRAGKARGLRPLPCGLKTARRTRGGAACPCNDPATAARHSRLIDGGTAWLAANQNAGGGWGDTADSPSNLATTMLAIAALHLAGKQAEHAQSLDAADRYVDRCTGGADRVEAISAVYGMDRTFAVPILMNCALAGLVPWERIPRLPFELAVLPHWSYRFVRLHVVSYALPALIAIGLLLDARREGSAVRRLVRAATESMALRKLAAIQPESGGFLEAIPLTSFVTMSLIPMYGAEQPVAQRCIAFIERSVRDGGGWAIDSDLSTWLTTGAVKALHAAGRLDAIGADRAGRAGRWIASCQCRSPHPYTNSEPGGWGWSHLSGSVPDVDDTSSAILAMTILVNRGGKTHREPEPAKPGTVTMFSDDFCGKQGGKIDENMVTVPSFSGFSGFSDGVRWLRRLQNADGGWPTFCRGWGRLPFDRSSPDLTAHALQALRSAGAAEGDAAFGRGLRYLRNAQRESGSWVPLWFGSQHAPGKENPVLGTSLVLLALCELDVLRDPAAKAAQFLIASQNSDGGWGGDAGVASSIEETARATAALAVCTWKADARPAAERGAAYLVGRIEAGSWMAPAPIGLYFASLWYSERLDPIIWTVEALGRAARAGIIVN